MIRCKINSLSVFFKMMKLFTTVQIRTVNIPIITKSIQVLMVTKCLRTMQIEHEIAKLTTDLIKGL